MITAAEIPFLNWQMSVAEFGGVAQGVDDINQCIRAILTTIRGSDPFRPEFGSDLYTFVDAPVLVAVPGVKLEIVRSIGRWEKRIQVNKIIASIDGNSILFRIFWSGEGISGDYLLEFSPTTISGSQTDFNSVSVINPATQPIIRRLDWQLGTVFGTIAQGVEDINQCILCAICTRKGSDPFRPEFGSDAFEWISAPATIAATKVTLAIRQAVERWEKRVVVLAVKYQFAKQNGDDFISGLIFSLSYRLAGGFTDNEAELIFGFAQDQIQGGGGSVSPEVVVRVLATEDLKGILTENEKFILP